MKTSFLTRLFDTVSPRTCAACGRRLTVDQTFLCTRCYHDIPLTHLEDHPYDNPMARLFWGKIPIERAAAYFYFYPHSEHGNIIYDMKYRGRPEIAQLLGAMAARRFAEKGFFDGIDAIIPLPVTRRRFWQRGYNQSVEIARGISSVTGMPILTDAVRRTKFTVSQTTMHGEDRQRNVEGAFLLKDQQRLAGLHVLLVDDIITSSATTLSCGRELAKAPGVRISIMSMGLTRVG